MVPTCQFLVIITLVLSFLMIPILGFMGSVGLLWHVIYVCQLFLSIWAENIIEFHIQSSEYLCI